MSGVQHLGHRFGAAVDAHQFGLDVRVDLGPVRGDVLRLDVGEGGVEGLFDHVSVLLIDGLEVQRL